MSRSTWILGLAMMVSSGCAQEAPPPVGETSAALASTFRWALGWVESPGTGAVSTTFQATSTGAVMTGTRVALGRYEIMVPGITELGGNVLVTPYGSNAHCSVVRWNNVTGGLKIEVRCFAPVTGSAFDTSFVVSYVFEALQPPTGSDHIRAAYMWYSNSASPAEPSYRWASVGGTSGVFTTTTSGTGRYRVEISGLAAPALPPGGVAQVSAYGAESRYCHVTDWSNVESSTRRYVDVRCFDPAGVPANSAFTLRYWTWASWGAAEGGSMVDVSPSLSSYTPVPVHQTLHTTPPASSGITVARSLAGSWDVSMPSLGWTRSGALINSLDPDGRYCTSGGWGPGVHVQVRCYTPAGAPADAKFTAAMLDGVLGP